MIKNNNLKVRVSKFYIIIIILLFLAIIARISYLCLVDFRVKKSTISSFINSRNIVEEILLPERGTIYDVNGDALAQDVSSYTVIAYLEKSRTTDENNPRHVVDVSYTANTLAPYLNMEVNDLLVLLSKEAYQVELGPGGRNLSELEKDNIAKLNLPGIDFIKSTKRYYPNGDFASYALGYTVNEEDKDGNVWLKGELGIEEYFNDNLKGKTGYITYEKDRYGYKIANGREYTEEAKDGDDIYLTIDSNIQLFIENALKKASSESEAEWGILVASDAKTGSILGYSSIPSYNPNEKNLTSYLDPLINVAYEPGSTMKIFSYMCAIEKGTYNGNATYLSGSKTYESKNEDEGAVTIKDWNKTGWGTLTYDQGFALSSNIAVANMLENFITKNELMDCYKKYGFGVKTGFSLKRELAGDINFKYDVEAVNAGFGQGITITPIQMIQALTAISNNGDMLKPYIVSKIVNNEDEETFKAEKKKLNNIASENTINKLKELMNSVIQEDSSISTGALYYMEDYKMMGKTGTAQIFDDKKNQYMLGDSDYIYSFAGFYPNDNPEVIVYMALKKPKDTTNYIAPAIKDLIVNISKYLNISTEIKKNTNYTLNNYVNKSTENVKNELINNGLNVILLGNGDKIINQYPKKNNILNKNNRVILLTNNYNKEMIDLAGYSLKEAINTLKLMNINYTIEGSGYVYEQSIQPGTIVGEETLNIRLKEKY